MRETGEDEGQAVQAARSRGLTDENPASLNKPNKEAGRLLQTDSTIQSIAELWRRRKIWISLVPPPSFNHYTK